VGVKNVDLLIIYVNHNMLEILSAPQAVAKQEKTCYNFNITIGGLPKVVRFIFTAGMPPFLLLLFNLIFK